MSKGCRLALRARREARGFVGPPNSHGDQPGVPGKEPSLRAFPVLPA